MLIKKISLFYQRPYHKPNSQLIWTETQLAVSIRTETALLNRNKFSNQISLFNVSKNDIFTGLMIYYMSAAGLWRFFVCEWNSYTIAIPQQEFSFIKLEKAHHRQFLVRKNYSKIFLFPNISQSMHIFFFSIQQP